MAKTLGCSPKQWADPSDFGDWKYKFLLIDKIRTSDQDIFDPSYDGYHGSIKDLLESIGWKIPDLNILYKGIDRDELYEGENEAWAKLMSTLKEMENHG